MSISLRSRIRWACLLGCASGAALFLLGVGQASAATTVYPAGGSSFTGNAENWTTAENEQSSPLAGLCIEGVTCPTITDEYQSAGGVEGSGFIETKEGGLASVGLLVKSSGIWESPAFTYTGAAGQRPTKVELSIARRAELSGLLAISGAEATYTTELVDQSSPTGSVVVTNAATLAGSSEWKTESASIAPSLLTAGHSYKVLVRTTFVTPAAVVPAGGAGYDNVALRATKVEAEGGSNGNNGSGGSNGTSNAGGGKGSTGSAGKNGANGSNALSAAQLRRLISSHGLVERARRHGSWIVVTGKCPKAIRRACTVRLRGMLTRHKTATVSRRAKIGKGARHQFIVSVRPGARHKVKGMRKILVKEWVRAGKTRVSVYKRLSLVGH